MRHVFRNKFGKDLQIAFRSGSGERIVIDSQFALEMAFKTFAGQDTMKLELTDPDVPRDVHPPATADLHASTSMLSGSFEELLHQPAHAPAGTSLLTQALRAQRTPSLSTMGGTPLPPVPPHLPAPAVASSSHSTLGAPGAQYVPLTLSPSSPRAESSSGSPQSPTLASGSSLMLSLSMKPDELTSLDLSRDLEEVKQQNKQNLFARLSDESHFGLPEIESLFQLWLQISPDGFLTKAQFAEGLRKLGVKDNLHIDHYFSAFDGDRNGRINFREFVVGMSTAQHGSPRERLQFMFKAYDTDGSGTLTTDEIFNMFRASLSSQGKRVDTAKLAAMVTRAFDVLDANKDGEISFPEFVAGVQQGILPNALPSLK
jgi:Ca2+-binding EF-hand superfamily protein